MYVAILAGGVGARLWPRSRQANPKQFSDITGTGRTMIQATADRLEGLVSPEQIYVVTGEQHAPLVAEQLPDIPSEQIIAEPSGRNTGPAIGLACMHLHRRDPDATLAVVTADHVILDSDGFQRSLQRAGEAAAQGHLVTIGIQPNFPHTGYGYIKRDRPLADFPETSTLPVYAVERFLEKPDRATAEQFLTEGGYYWNSGIFVFQVSTMLSEMARQIPDVHDCLQEIGAGIGQPNEAECFADGWERMPSISIDYGVAEGAEQVAVVPMLADWNDIGSWDALEMVVQKNEQGNCVAKGNVVSIDSRGNIIYSDKKVTALIDVTDLVVVETEDALLIGHKSQMQKVKQVVEQLKESEQTALL